MDTNPKVISPDTKAASEPLSGNLNSGNLDSDFFCELNGITTQFPHKSSSVRSDSSKELVPLNHDDSILQQDGIEDQRTEIPPHKQGKNKALLITGLVSVPMAVAVFMMFGGSSEPAKIVQAAAETPQIGRAHV